MGMLNLFISEAGRMLGFVCRGYGSKAAQISDVQRPEGRFRKLLFVQESGQQTIRPHISPIWIGI